LNRKPVQLIIPAAGAGKRFRDTGIDTPKPLIPVGSLPMILWVVGNFELFSNDRVIIVGQERDNLKERLNPWISRLALDIEFLEVPVLTGGPASTVQMALPGIDMSCPVIVANSDQFVSRGVSEFVDATRSGKFAGVILTMEASGTKWSYLKRDTDGVISEVVEKVEVSNEATVGIYGWASGDILRDSINDMVARDFRVNNEFYIAPTYNYLISTKQSIHVVSAGSVGDSVHGLGTPEDLDTFQKLKNFQNLQSRAVAAMLK